MTITTKAKKQTNKKLLNGFISIAIPHNEQHNGQEVIDSLYMSCYSQGL